MGIQGAIGGKPHKTRPCPLDIGAFDTKAPLANRPFRLPAPNMLRVSDDTYLATWKGFAYVAFRVKAYARRSVGWRVSTSPHAGFGLDALRPAVHPRRPVKGAGPVHHSDRGRQCLSINGTERLAEAGIRPVPFTGLFKTEANHRRGPWRREKAVEQATLEWADWRNNRPPPTPIAQAL